jgi:plastocyanin
VPFPLTRWIRHDRLGCRWDGVCRLPGSADRRVGTCRVGAYPSRDSAPRCRSILDERLARREISPDEHLHPREVLGAGPRAAPRYLGVLAAVFVAVGILGGLSAVAAATDFGGMGFFDMRGMMGGSPSGSTDTAPAPVPGARHIRVVADEFNFDPSEIRIGAGERVNVTLDNRGNAVHTLTISKLDFELRTDGGKRAEGSLQVDTPGRYPFTCDIPGHAEACMRGTVIVRPAA